MIGRQKEQMELRKAYESKESQLVAIYGRRRIGKTYLVNEAFNHVFAFHHSGLKRGGLKEQLKQFWMSLRQQGHWDCPKLKDWQEAFFELGNFLSRLPEGRKVVFLDEMPWMDTFRSNFLMAFEGFWNGWAAFRTDILLVVCGSATTWILKKSFTTVKAFTTGLRRELGWSLLPFTNAANMPRRRGLDLTSARSQNVTWRLAASHTTGVNCPRE